MFNLGFLELMAIGTIALIVLGPKQLPVLAKSLGHMFREFKKATADLSGGLLEVEREIKAQPQTEDSTKKTSAEGASESATSPQPKPSQDEPIESKDEQTEDAVKEDV